MPGPLDDTSVLESIYTMPGKPRAPALLIHSRDGGDILMGSGGPHDISFRSQVFPYLICILQLPGPGIVPDALGIIRIISEGLADLDDLLIIGCNYLGLM